MPQIGKLIFIVGLILIVIGTFMWVSPKIPWIGNLPGDIDYKGNNVRVYIPIATCIILSVVLSVLMFLIGKK